MTHKRLTVELTDRELKVIIHCLREADLGLANCVAKPLIIKLESLDARSANPA